MATLVQQPNNIFAAPQLQTRPVEVYDPNQGWRGKPTAKNIGAAFTTPQAKLQIAQPQQPQTQPQEKDKPIDPNSSTAGMDYINSLYTSPEDEKKMRRASIANQRILAVGDALRQIGNIYHTTQYAPSQKFNSPVMEENARYQQGKALRDAANMKYYSYQQAKAQQDAANRRWELDFELKMDDAARKAGYTEAQIQAMKDRIANQKAYQDANVALGNRRADDAKAANEARIKEQNRHNRVSEGQRSQSLKMQRERTNAYVNRAKSGSSGVAPLDTPKGQITPNGRSYSNQLLQMFDYAKSKGYVKETDVAKRLRELGFGKDQSDNVKRQMVMDLLRTNQDMGDYASSRLGWTYGGGTAASDWDQYAEDEENWNDYLDD